MMALLLRTVMVLVAAICIFSEGSYAQIMPKLPRILLTGFAPYTTDKNASFDIASKIIADYEKEKSSQANQAEYDLFLCPEVPNSFQNAAAHVLKCIDEVQPDFVISLGQSPVFSIVVETVSANIYGGFFDNVDDELYFGYEAINSDTEKLWRDLSLPFEQIYRSYRLSYSLDDEIPFIVGATPLNFFICNKLAYDVQTALSTRGIAYGFIHIPSYDVALEKKLTTEHFIELVSARINTILDSLPKRAKLSEFEQEQFLKQQTDSIDEATRIASQTFSTLKRSANSGSQNSSRTSR